MNKSLRNLIVLLVTSVLWSATSNAQELVAYKQVDSTTLYLEVHKPKEITEEELQPAMVFFFGGGWNSGSRAQFSRYAKDLSSKGIVCFLADYRIKQKHGTTPFESLKDAKSAVRFIRANADRFGIDPQKIIASGGSAGGHLAAATALSVGFDEASDDLLVSCKPNALVIYNGVIDNGPGGYGYERIGDAYKNFSPLHNIARGAPPTLLLLGTKDHLIKTQTYDYYKLVMDKVGSPCEVHYHEGGKHGFFNYNKKKPAFYNASMAQTIDFLRLHGFIAALQ